jgi:hypothetical protein
VKISIKLAAILLLLSLSAATETAETDCTAIEDPSERLACFDAVYGNADATESIEQPLDRDDLVEIEPDSAAVEPSAAAVIPATVPSEPVSSEDVSGQAEKKTGFLGDELVNVTTTISAILAGDKQKMVFELDNGQIWLQSSPRNLPFKEGDVVTVKNALLGGYFLRSEKGVSTRVNRIR